VVVVVVAAEADAAIASKPTNTTPSNIFNAAPLTALGHSQT
jgi:hypothetical protein